MARLMRSPSSGQVEDPFSARFHLCRSGRHPDGASSLGGLRMSQVFEHKPVMLDEVVELFGPVPPGTVVDATVGGGGHARALLGAHPQLRLLGIDQDEEALAAAADSLGAHADRVTLRRGRFDAMATIVAKANVAPVSGVLFDLGVSSWQLDRGERGFSYRSEAALDMRMDRAQPRTASDVVNGYSERDLARILVENGERRWAGRIAKAIIGHRPIETTSQLAEIVRTAIPAATRPRRPSRPCASRSTESSRSCRLR